MDNRFPLLQPPPYSATPPTSSKGSKRLPLGLVEPPPYSLNRPQETVWYIPPLSYRAPAAGDSADGEMLMTPPEQQNPMIVQCPSCDHIGTSVAELVHTNGGQKV